MVVCKDHRLFGLGLVAWRAGLGPGGAYLCSDASPAHGSTRQGEMSGVGLSCLPAYPALPWRLLSTGQLVPWCQMTSATGRVPCCLTEISVLTSGAIKC